MRNESFDSPCQRVTVVDTHTGGEPTRVVIAGGPDLGGDSLTERRERFREQYDAFRSAVANEPRGSDVMVGALLCSPQHPDAAAGVIFFNNVGYLGMCGHGTMGVVVALGYLGRIAAGRHRLETPVGPVTVDYDGRSRVTVENVPSYRYAARVAVEVPSLGIVQGDVAWGGNWFFLVDDESHRQILDLSRLDELTDCAWKIRQALEAQGISGAHGQPIDHIELLGPPWNANAHCRNFVLCPGKAYDRSPCGTGTSAKIACLYADGKLKPGEIWRQESIIGSLFEATYRLEGDHCLPQISGTAFVQSEATLILDPRDPFCWGIRNA